MDGGSEGTGKPGAAPLRPFIPFIVLLMFSYTKDDIEVFMMYFLFASSSYGCEFGEAYGIYLYVNAIVQIITQPMWARITDRYAAYSTVLLWSALLGETVIEIFMFTLPGDSFGLILILSLIRSVIHTENTLAIWKIFKQKLDFSHFRDTAAHDNIINNIGMWGIVGEVVLDVSIFSVAYYLCIEGINYRLVAGYIYFMTTFPSLLVWLISYIWFTPEYVEGSHQHNPIDSILDGACPNRMPSRKSLNAKLSHFHPIRLDKLPDADIIDLKHNESTIEYFTNGFHHIYNNPVCLTGLVHAFFVCLFWMLMNAAVPLNLASSHMDNSLIPSLENFCAGQITNLFYQLVWNNMFYITGALLYIAILIRTPPIHFYKYAWPLISVFFTLCITPLLYSVPYSIQVFLAAAVAVFPFFLWRYDTYLCNASVDNQYVGVLQAIIGYIRYITPAVPGFFLAYGMDSVVFLVAFITLFLSVIYSIYAGITNQKELEAITSKEHKEHHIITKIEKVISHILPS